MWVSFDRYRQGGGGGGGSPVRSRTKWEKLSSTPATSPETDMTGWRENILEMSALVLALSLDVLS